MAEQMPTVQWTVNQEIVFTAKFQEPFKSGQGQYGGWHMWTFSSKGHGVTVPNPKKPDRPNCNFVPDDSEAEIDVVIFASDRLNATFLAAGMAPGVYMKVVKAQDPGSTSSYFKVWKAEGDQWVPIEAPDEPEIQVQQTPVPPPSGGKPPAPVPGPKADPTPPTSGASRTSPPPSKGVTIHALLGVYGDCLSGIQGVLSKAEINVEHDKVVEAATTIFIAATKPSTCVIDAISVEEVAESLGGPELDGPLTDSAAGDDDYEPLPFK